MVVTVVIHRATQRQIFTCTAARRNRWNKKTVDLIEFTEHLLLPRPRIFPHVDSQPVVAYLLFGRVPSGRHHVHRHQRPSVGWQASGDALSIADGFDPIDLPGLWRNGNTETISILAVSFAAR
jgi:hypothetical protein